MSVRVQEVQESDAHAIKEFATWRNNYIVMSETLTYNRPMEPTQSIVSEVSGSDDLVRTLYEELRKLARSRMRRLKPGQTLQPTALVHEVYIRLKKKRIVKWNSRRHFFGAAAIAMRDILVEAARRKSALKRGGDLVQVDLPFTLIADKPSVSVNDLVAMHRAIDKMQRVYPEYAEVVLLHCFAGLSLAEVATMVDASARTVMRRWRFARAWLFSGLGGTGDEPN